MRNEVIRVFWFVLWSSRGFELFFVEKDGELFIYEAGYPSIRTEHRGETVEGPHYERASFEGM